MPSETILKYSIFYVIDGDTLLLGKTKDGVLGRFRWVDAPEISHGKTPKTEVQKSQYYWGEKSRLYLNNLLKNKTIIVIQNGVDQYNRIIIDCYIDNSKDKLLFENNVQINLVRNGICANTLPFQQYEFKNDDVNLYCEILKAGSKAFNEKLGFWSDNTGNFTLPYYFKRITKSATNP